MITFSVACFSIFSKGGRFKNADLAFVLQMITDVVVFFSISLRLCAELFNYMTSS